MNGRRPPPGSPSKTMLTVWAALLASLLPLVSTNPIPGLQSPDATIDEVDRAIVVTWNYVNPTEGVSFVLRYRTNNRPEHAHWKTVRTIENSIRLYVFNEIREGDRLEFQIQVERNGQVLEPWSTVFYLTILNLKQMSEAAFGGNDLLPPLDFTTIALSPTSIRLEWTRNPENIQGLYYLVDIKQVTSRTGGTLLRQEIKATGESIQIGDLRSGEKYEMTVRTATSPDRISNSAIISECIMPTSEEFFKIETIQVTSLFRSNLQGSVNLTWEVPPEKRRNMKEFVIFYKDNSASSWQTMHLSGQASMASFTTLKSDTEYFLKVHTVLFNDITMESGQFKFKTSKVIISPIKDIKVIYLMNGDTLQLQWTLESFLHESQVTGYDLYISETNQVPLSQWHHFYVTTNEITLPLTDFTPSSNYFVKITVRKVDGTVMSSPNTYRFQTMAHVRQPVERMRTNELRYASIGAGRVKITWSFTNADSIRGSTVLYSEIDTLPVEQWSKVYVEDPQQATAILTNLKPNTRYYIRIVPEICETTCDIRDTQLYEIRTDPVYQTPSVNPETPREEDGNRPKILESPTSPAFQDMRIREEEQKLCLKICNPDAIRPTCSHDERCVASLDDPNVGWCVSERLRDAIFQS